MTRHVHLTPLTWQPRGRAVNTATPAARPPPTPSFGTAGTRSAFGRKRQAVPELARRNSLLSTTNERPWRQSGSSPSNAGAQPMTLADVNRYLIERICPRSWSTTTRIWTKAGNVQMFIPQGYGVLVGARDYGRPPCGVSSLARHADLIRPGGGSEAATTRTSTQTSS